MAIRLEPDNTVDQLPLNEVGWVGVDRNSDTVRAQTQHLMSNSGIRGLEVLHPDEVDRACEVFFRDGFVVIQDALDALQLADLQQGCDREIHSLLAKDKNRSGNRGSHRYSFGSASRTGQLMHCPEWTMLIDLDSLRPILQKIFGSDEYICRGGGGDFCLPGATQYQPLHSDMSDVVHHEHKGKTYTFGSFTDPRGRINYRDLPTPYVCCNFLINDATPLNGPTRQIPGTQNSHTPIPSLDQEPDWMKFSTVCPAPAGSVMIRDVRAWHGGTPNLSDEVRAIPNVEYFAPWYREPLAQSMPRSMYDKLSKRGQYLSRYIVADSDEVLETGYKGSLGGTPTGF